MRVRRLLIIAPLVAAGCAQRTLNVKSDPPGALVFLNDREVGRTPFNKDFLWYGNYDVVVRKDGYSTLKTTREITAPFWQWVPFDLVTDFLPLHDQESMNFRLKPEPPLNAPKLLANGEQMRGQLESSENTIQPNVLNIPPRKQPTTKATTHPTTAPKHG